ncbi:MAG: ABC transporter ATP-binding protein [Proteobacteria bacterium]|nr:ABC transporter ATP-binding protein [Cystobacterineae bacterium]MCL2313936.1 ABC transporter ATP-binding protein [Pseudomonadota bacterium]
MLKCQALSLRRPPHPPLLEDIHFEAEGGQLWVLLGPNGSGKTTLLKTLMGILAPSFGQVSLHGKPLARYGYRERARHMAWVPQHLPEDSAFLGVDLVAMGRLPFCKGLRGPGKREYGMALGMLDSLGLHALAYRPVGQLSGGERRMLWLARAFLQTPQVLCLDEPTAFLDLPRQSFSLELLQQRCRQEGLLALVVLHELNLAMAYATHALLLKGGRVLAQGPAAQCLQTPTLEALLDMPLMEAHGPHGKTLLGPRPPPPCPT